MSRSKKKNEPVISRRRLFQVCAIGSAALAVVGAPSLRYALYRPDLSLSGLVNEEDGWIYRGFPSRLEKSNFEQLDLLLRDSDQQIVFIGEEHRPEVRKKVVSLVDFLVYRHGFDSIGLESVAGAPKPTMKEEYIEAFDRFCGGRNTIRVSRAGKMEEFDIIGVKEAGAYAKYARQESVPTFGIENKELDFEYLCHYGLIQAIIHVGGYLEKGVKYKDIPFIQAFEEYANFVRKKYPNVPYNLGNSMYTITLNAIRGGPEVKKLLAYSNDLRHLKGNSAMGKNIGKYMRQLGSKKSVIILGNSHLLDAQGVFDILGVDNFSAGFSERYSPVQGLVSCSALPVVYRGKRSRS